MIHLVCREIILELRINRFVETGTFVGETVSIVSEWFQDLDPAFGKIIRKEPNSLLKAFFSQKELSYPLFDGADAASGTKLYSVDVDSEKQGLLRQVFCSNPNIFIVNDSSEKFLNKSIDEGLLSNTDRTLFYLDAHWGEHWPLRDEITQILRLQRSIIVIDDFVVPFHPWHGFDIYRTTICGWYYIGDLFRNYDHQIYYTSKPNSDNRGTVIIFVGYHGEEQVVMNKLPCFKPFMLKGAPFITLATKFIASMLIVLGIYDKLLDFYLARKWGALDKAPCKRMPKNDSLG
jgi:hypothetical protein